MKINKVQIQTFFKTNSKLILLFLGLFILSVGGSWALFSFVIKGTSIKPVSTSGVGAVRSKIDPSLPKTEACPINGLKYTTQERSIWEGRRPATIMVENHADSRPPEGLSKADFVYEAVAEGGITRFLGIFYCGVAAGDVKVAPVRSARVYFINWASEYGSNPLYVHVGGANDFCPTCYGGVKAPGTIDPQVDALGLLQNIGWRVPGGNDYDAAYDTGYPIFYRNPERLGHEIATEHTMTVDIDALYQDAEKRGFSNKNSKGVSWDKNFRLYKFVDGSKVSSPNASDISFKFWENKADYDVTWKYDSTNNQYLRFNGGQPHTDLEYNKVQLSATNVIVMEINERGPVDEEGHMFYQNIGSGKALLFQSGTVIQINWAKSSRADRTIFTDSAGKEIQLVRGVTWVEGIPTGNTVNYK
ncbi:MAG TPA: DUF3048 domain-containing protein [Candidatus Saccharimonadales bacterium]|nr:DUF3048 domain-containing protein [Candidatus Saccharimonadales bacterium]